MSFQRFLALALGCLMVVLWPLPANVLAMEADGENSMLAVEIAKRRCVFIETDAALTRTSVLSALSEAKGQCGTGVILEKDLVLTNAHVVDRPNARVFVDGKPAHVLKTSSQYDLALLSVETRDVPRVQMQGQTERNQQVFYVGNPGARRELIFPGRIRAVDQQFIFSDSFHEVQAAIGASGSGLYSTEGLLLGIKKGMLPGTHGRPSLSVAIPVRTISEFLGGDLK